MNKLLIALIIIFPLNIYANKTIDIKWTNNISNLHKNLKTQYNTVSLNSYDGC